MVELYYKRDNCRLCGSSELDMAASLAPMPIATPNFNVEDADGSGRVFTEGIPLDLYLCRDCGHVQILDIGNPDLQYRNYVYNTSHSLGLREHFGAYAKEVIARLQPPTGRLIVELGSNDGTLLRFFKDAGFRVLGVDPATRIAEEATASGIETIPAFFNASVAGEIVAKHGQAKIIVANNMIANVDDIIGFRDGIAELMAPDGVFIFETQYGKDVFEKMLLDTVYHEHLSYFNVKPALSFFEAANMQVFDAELISTKGGSIRVFVKKIGGPNTVSSNLGKIVATEEREGWYDLATYSDFAKKVRAIRERLAGLVSTEQATGNIVVGYGVSVGTTSLLPQFGLEEKLDFLVDDNPLRGPTLKGPGYNIPVHLPSMLYERTPGMIVVFAWRYVEPIMTKHPDLVAKGVKFVVPLPEVAVL
jgi:hypothetical protein